MLTTILFKKILGWEITGKINPDLKKAVVIVYPHTSWHDFYIGVLARRLLKVEINFVAKQELFDSPLGWYFKWMGGAPINRKKSKKTVDQIVNVFRERNEFRLGITPEGTRQKVDHWKTGFYHIARAAEVPVIPIAFDYSLKQVIVYDPISTANDMEDCFTKLRNCYGQVTGKFPENTSAIG